MDVQTSGSNDDLGGARRGRRKKACPYGVDKRKGKRGRCLKHKRPRKRR